VRARANDVHARLIRVGLIPAREATRSVDDRYSLRVVVDLRRDQIEHAVEHLLDRSSRSGPDKRVHDVTEERVLERQFVQL